MKVLNNLGRVFNWFWNLYSSLCSRIKKKFFVDGCVSSGASLIQVFRWWRVVQREQRKKKRKKGKGREEGFFPFSSCPQHLFFFRSLFFAPSHTIWTPGIRGFSGASRLGCGRKKERQQSHQCVKAVTRDQAFFFFFGRRGKFSLTVMLLHSTYTFLVSGWDSGTFKSESRKYSYRPVHSPLFSR